MQTEPRSYKVGELAAATGLTVRTLHHYDRIGLLSPKGRTPSGYRLYGSDEVRRLYQIVALRRLGLSLEDVAAVLTREDADARSTIERHLSALERDIELREQLRYRLRRLLEAVGRAESASDHYVEILEVMSLHENYYTPEQLAQLEERRKEFGEEGIKKAEQDWADLLAAVEKEYEAGTDPADPKMQELAAKWSSLIEAFTGGDPGIRASLQKMYESEGPEKASRGMVRPEIMQYAMRAINARS